MTPNQKKKTETDSKMILLAETSRQELVNNYNFYINV